MEDEILDYASMTDEQLTPIIHDLIDSGLTDSQIRKHLYGPEINDPDDVRVNAFQPFLKTTPEAYQELTEDTYQQGDFIFNKKDPLTPISRVERVATLPSHKTVSDIKYLNLADPDKNISDDVPGGFYNEEWLLRNGYKQKPVITRISETGRELYKKPSGVWATTKNGLITEWEKHTDVPGEVITENEYNRKKGGFSFDDDQLGVPTSMQGYDPEGDISFDDWVKKWNAKVEEQIIPWDPELSKEEYETMELRNNKLKEIGKINADDPRFDQDLLQNTPRQIQEQFFELIRQTGWNAGIEEDERNEIFDGGTRVIEEAQKAGKFEQRDNAIKAMFGEEKGNEVIDYLNANPIEYLNMVDWAGKGQGFLDIIGEPASNVVSELGDAIDGPGAVRSLSSHERRTSNEFLEKMGILDGSLPGDTSLTPWYTEWLDSDAGAHRKTALLNDYKQRMVRAFIGENTGSGEEFDHTIVRKNLGYDPFGLWGYGSDLIKYSTPENQLIYKNNRKTQQEFIKHAEEKGYDPINGLTLEVGKPQYLDGRRYELAPYVKPHVQEEYYQEMEELIGGIVTTESKKFDLINEKIKPYFDAIKNSNNVLRYFKGDTIGGGVESMTPVTREMYSTAIRDQNKAIEELENSGLLEEFNSQTEILEGLASVNDTFFDQAEALSNLGMMTAGALKNQSEISRMMNSFARTAFTFDMALRMTGNEMISVFSPELDSKIMNEPWLNATEAYNKASEEEFAPKVDWDTYLPGEGGSWFGQTLAESAPTLAMVMGPSLIGRLMTKGATNSALKTIAAELVEKGASKRVIDGMMGSAALRRHLAQQVMNRASNASMGMFMGTSWAGKKLEMNLMYSQAPKKIEEIKKLLDELPAEAIDQRIELLGALNNYENIVNSSKWSREVDAIGYGLVDGVSERLGTLAFVNKVGRLQKSWKNLNRAEKWKRAIGYDLRSGMGLAAKQMLVEVGEEYAAQLGHNFIDKVFGEHKSIFDGMDMNLAMDSAINILAMQTPAYGGNILRVVRDEVTTFKDKQKVAKRGARIRKWKKQLQTENDPVKIKELRTKIEKELQAANIDEFNSYQRFRSLTNEELEELVQLGGLRAKVGARYLEHMSLQPEKKNVKATKAWQAEQKYLEAELTRLRDRQGNILNTIDWKRYQNWTKIAQEYQENPSEELAAQQFQAGMEYKKSLAKGFMGEKKAIDEAKMSVLPKEVRFAEYASYQAALGLALHYGDVTNNDNFTINETMQDVMDMDIENNRCS
ncbi:MAG: hypothetical protein QGI18_05725 [Candidatus Marinimicrobia bacterium]|nr:hypothetical protein [Candidatus Neomarinimicrobiota bacterium]